jgi:crotonobetainyl-CoA:carnitine CoA-transferase CaiB-like acyl-CoA transferase
MKKIKIVDVSSLIPGPFASFLLAKHLNCEVLKIEDTNQPDPLINMRPTKNGIGLGYLALNENKKIIKVDFREKGVDMIKDEAKDADIFIENFKTGRTLKLGVAYEDLIKNNSRLIYCSITGFAPKSALSGKSAHDLNILALSGYLEQQYKLGDRVPLPPLLLADSFTAHNAALRVAAAIIKNELPCHVEISMHEALLEAMTINNYPQLITNNDFSTSEFLFSGRLPCYGVFDTKDGRKVAVAALEKPLWVDFCTHLKREDLTEKQYEPEITQQIEAELKKYEMEHWLSNDLDFCVTPVLSYLEAVKLKYV